MRCADLYYDDRDPEEAPEETERERGLRLRAESAERQLAVAEAEAAELRRHLDDLERRGVIPPPNWPRPAA